MAPSTIDFARENKPFCALGGRRAFFTKIGEIGGIPLNLAHFNDPGPSERHPEGSSEGEL